MAAKKKTSSRSQPRATPKSKKKSAAAKARRQGGKRSTTTAKKTAKKAKKTVQMKTPKKKTVKKKAVAKKAPAKKKTVTKKPVKKKPTKQASAKGNAVKSKVAKSKESASKKTAARAAAKDDKTSAAKKAIRPKLPTKKKAQPVSRGVALDRRKQRKFRPRLLEEQRAVLQAFSSAKGDTDISSDGTEDYIDYAVSSYTREFSLSLSEMERKQLRLIDEALKRIDRGEFGLCLNCATAIPEPRLQVEPWARYCIKCQELDELGLLEEREAELEEEDDGDVEEDDEEVVVDEDDDDDNDNDSSADDEE